MISDGAAEAIKEDDAMSVFFMDFDMAPSVIWARDLYDQMQIRSDFRKWFPRMRLSVCLVHLIQRQKISLMNIQDLKFISS